MSENTFKNNPNEVIYNFHRDCIVPPLALLNYGYRRIGEIMRNKPHYRNDLGLAIDIATDSTLEMRGTELLASLTLTWNPILPDSWREDPNIQRAIFSMTSSTESGILIAHSVWAATTGDNKSAEISTRQAKRLQLLHQDLQATT